MKKENVNPEVYRIYENCSKHMNDSENDWQKAYNAFRSVCHKHKNNQSIVNDAVKAYVALENQFRIFAGGE